MRTINYTFMLSFLWTNFMIVNSSKKSYSRSIVELEKLAYSELSIIRQVYHGRQTLPDNSVLKSPIEMYFKEFEKSVGGNWTDWSVEKAKIIARNPISTFSLIRRYAYYLPYFLQRVQTELDISNDEVELKPDVWPDQEDIDEAMEGILRLHHIYDLNIVQFSAGYISGVFTGAALEAVHCYELGIYGKENKYFSLAIEWLELAQRLAASGDDSIEKSYIAKELTAAINTHNEELAKSEGWEPLFFLEQITDTKYKIALDRVKRRNNLVRHFKGKRKANFLHMNYWSLCLGENLQSEKEKSKLFCWLERKINLVYTIGPLKMELLARNPDMVQIYNVTGDKFDKVQNDIVPDLKKSVVLDFTQPQNYEVRSVVSQERTSMTWWMLHKEIKELSRINQNIELMTGLKVLTPTSSEPSQIVSYTSTGHYNPHLDTLMDETLHKPRLGDRMATFMVYLSDVESGGQTTFPMVGASAHLVKGSAVFWYNVLQDGTTDESTYNAACPVMIGSKLISNKWIKMNDQFQTQMCDSESGPKQRFQVPVNGKFLPLVTFEADTDTKKNGNKMGQTDDLFSYGSVPALKYLVQMESEIYDFLQTTLESGNCKGTPKKPGAASTIKKYLNDYEETTGKLVKNIKDTNSQQEKVSWNPLACYRMLRRFEMWLGIFAKPKFLNCRESYCSKVQEFLAERKSETYWPSSRAFADAMTGLLILHSVYDLNPQDIASGIVGGVDNGIILDGFQCFEIGQFAVMSGFYSYGIDWLELAAIKLNQTQDYQMVVKALRAAKVKHDDAFNESQGWEPHYFTRAFYEKDEGERVQRKLVQYNAFKFMEEPQFSEINYGGICTGKAHQTEAQKAKLFCWYESKIHPYWTINPVKAEFHSIEPKLEIVQYYDLLNDKTIDKIIESSKPSLKLSTTIGSFDDSERTSNTKLRLSANAWLSENSFDVSLKASKIVEMVTGLKVIEMTGDDLQVSSYTPGSHYVVHTDASGYDQDSTGHRIATCMFYLSDVDTGGYTAFSQAGTQVKPAKGSAVFWYNLRASGALNEQTWHGSCPIIFGEKWVANKWIHYETQQSYKTCHTDENKMDEILINGKSKYG